MSNSAPTSPVFRTTQQIVAVCGRQHGVAAPDQIVAAGLTPSGIRKRVEAGRLFKIYGAYALSPVLTEDGYRMAAVLSCRRPTLLSGWSAAEILGFADRPSQDHHVTTMARHGSRRGLVVHRTRVELPHVVVRGIPVTEAVRVLLDLARGLEGRALERLVGEALHARVVRDRDLDTVGDRYPGHPGLGRLATVSAQDARRRRTVRELAERMLRALDALPIPGPICEYRLRGFSGRRYRADFAWPDRKVILEADGRAAHERRQAMEDDRMRDADLAAAGWTTLRFTWRQLHRERAMFDRLVTATVGRV